MTPSVSLNQLIERGVDLQAHEAVALALRLIDTCTTGVDLTPPLGPPTLESVRLGVDGSVVCRGCAVTPAVSEIGIFLETMLPRGVTRAPGGLRYTIARSLLEVDAPPFDSLAELSAALARYERGDRTSVLRELYARFTASSGRVVAPFVERRRRSPSTDELRRHLREADRELYERRSTDRHPPAAVAVDVSALQLREVPMASAADVSGADAPAADASAADSGALLTFPTPTQTPRRTPLRWIAATATAAALSFAAGRTVVLWRQAPHASNPPISAVGDRARSSVPLARAEAPERSAARPADTAAGAGVGSTVLANPAARTAPPAADSGPTVTLARALDSSNGPAFSPSFASNGTLFFHTGRTADARSDIASADLTGDLRVMTIADDGARNYHVQPSPDDARVAFDSDRDGERGVYVASRDGTGVKRVSGSGYAAVPTWSPDGDRLAFIRAETDRPHVWNLWLLVLDTGEMRRLTTFPYGQTWGASWFGDGRRIAYTHEDRLLVLDLDSGSMRRFPSPIARRLLRTPAVSPDGRYIIFQLARSGAWLLDLSDGSMRCVLTDPTAEEFAWSPDGRRVAFHSRRDGQWGIWLMGPS